MNNTTMKTRLTARLERSRAKRAEATVGQAKASTCDHAWQRYVESIVPERTERQRRHSNGFAGRSAYFVVRGCPKCRQKRRVQLVVN